MVGQVIRRTGAGDSLKSAIPLLQDPEPQVRAHTAALLGNAHHTSAWQQLIHCLEDENRRVQMYASFALAKIPRPDVVTPLLKVLKDNNDQDPALRHAVVMALASLGNPTRLLDQFDDAGQDLQKSKSVRIGVVVALRRLRASEITPACCSISCHEYTGFLVSLTEIQSDRHPKKESYLHRRCPNLHSIYIYV